MKQWKAMPAQTQTGFSTPMDPQHGVQPLGAPPCPSVRGCPIAAKPEPASHAAGSTGPGTQGGPETCSHTSPAAGSGGQGETRSPGPKQANLKRCGFAQAAGQRSCCRLRGSRERPILQQTKYFSTLSTDN